MVLEIVYGDFVLESCNVIVGWGEVIYPNYQNGEKPHTRLCHLTSFTMQN